MMWGQVHTACVECGQPVRVSHYWYKATSGEIVPAACTFHLGNADHPPVVGVMK